MKRVISGLILTLVLSACAISPKMPAADLQCHILADLGQALAADNYDPVVLQLDKTKIDCSASFRAAALPMTVSDKRGVRFVTPLFYGNDKAVVFVDFFCFGLCGHGEKITLHRGDSGWKIAKREMTWIS